MVPLWVAWTTVLTNSEKVCLADRAKFRISMRISKILWENLVWSSNLYRTSTKVQIQIKILFLVNFNWIFFDFLWNLQFLALFAWFSSHWQTFLLAQCSLDLQPGELPLQNLSHLGMWFLKPIKFENNWSGKSGVWKFILFQKRKE